VTTKWSLHARRVSTDGVGSGARASSKQRLDGIVDDSVRGAPRSIDDARVDAVIAKTLEVGRKSATQWSTRTMRASWDVCKGCHAHLAAFGLQPHRQETFSSPVIPSVRPRKVADMSGC
jgi:hypothetical protein